MNRATAAKIAAMQSSTRSANGVYEAHRGYMPPPPAPEKPWWQSTSVIIFAIGVVFWGGSSYAVLTTLQARERDVDSQVNTLQITVSRLDERQNALFEVVKTIRDDVRSIRRDR